MGGAELGRVESVMSYATSITSPLVPEPNRKKWGTGANQRRPVDRFLRKAHKAGKESVDEMIDALIEQSPLYGGIPREPAQILLEGCNVEVPRGRVFRNLVLPQQLETLGLMMMIPGEPGRKRWGSKTNIKGLKLLQGWRDRYPRFRPFYEAYVPRKVEKRIITGAVTHVLEGKHPEVIEAEKRVERGNKRVSEEKRKEQEDQMEYIKLIQEIYKQSKSTPYVTWGATNTGMWLSAHDQGYDNKI